MRLSTWFYYMCPHACMRLSTWLRACVQMVDCVCPHGYMCLSTWLSVCIYPHGCMRVSTWSSACVHVHMVACVCPHAWMRGCMLVSTWLHVCVHMVKCVCPHGFITCVHMVACVCPNGWLRVSTWLHVFVHMVECVCPHGCMRVSTWLHACVHMISPPGYIFVLNFHPRVEKFEVQTRRGVCGWQGDIAGIWIACQWLLLPLYTKLLQSNSKTKSLFDFIFMNLFDLLIKLIISAWFATAFLRFAATSLLVLCCHVTACC